MNKRLLNGKSGLERVVGIEINDNIAEVFVQKEDGEIESVIHKNRFWLLSDKNINGRFKRLDGDLHYKWGVQFNERRDFLRYRSIWKHSYDLYSIFNSQEATMVKDGICFFQNMKFDELSVLSFDIETTGLEHDDTSKVLLISNTFRKNGKIERKLFCYDDYETDKEFIDDWCAWVRWCDPTILVTHNGSSFDIPYLSFCASRAGTSLCIGRDDSEVLFDTWESKFRKSKEEFVTYKKAHVYGRQIIDTYFLSIKYDIGKKYVSYGLKQIISQEIIEFTKKKNKYPKWTVTDQDFLDRLTHKGNRTIYDASKIRVNYQNPEEWEKIKAYCVGDGDDALTLFDLMAPPFFYMAQNIPKPFQLINESATGSQINSIMVRAYIQDGHSIPKADEVHKFQGAISLGKPGLYKNCVRWDIQSLYPSIIRQFKIYSKEKDPKAYFLALTDYFTTERLKNKALAKQTGLRYYDDMQASQKLGANSLYGFLGTNGLQFNYPQGAELITKKGREILIKGIEWATGGSYETWNETEYEP